MSFDDLPILADSVFRLAVGDSAWGAIAVLSALAVGGCKKLEWVARSAFSLSLIGWQYACWLLSDAPPDEAILPILDALDGTVSREGSTLSGKTEDGTEVAVHVYLGNLQSVKVDGLDVTASLDARDRRHILKAAAPVIARLDAEAVAAAEAEKAQTRSLLASLKRKKACGCGTACDCGPGCACP